MSLSLGGVLSGIDYDVLIQSMLQAEMGPISRAQEMKADYKSMNSAITSIRGAFNALKMASSSLSSADTLRKVSASSSDKDVLTVSASSGASEGSHSIQINQLAQSHKLVHDAGLAFSDSLVGNGGSISTSRNDNAVVSVTGDTDTWFTTGAEGATYSFQFGTQDAISIDLESNTSYSITDVANLINTAAGYTAAQAVDEGADTWKLDLTAKVKGDTSGLTVSLSEGTAVAELADDQWTDTNGTDPSSGVFSYSYDGVTRSLSTGAMTSLSDLVDLINNDGSNPGVKASLIQHNDAYHLVLAGTKTGADYTISIDSTTTTIDTFDNDAAQWVESQAAQDAQYRVDGYPTEASGQWMESSSNSVTDAIPGVTMNFQETTAVGESVNITLTRDSSSVQSKMNTLVSAYNQLYETIDLHVGYNSATGQGGVLQGDSIIRSLLEPIRNMLTRDLTSFSATDDTFNSGLDLGISVDRDGVMTLDSDTFQDALADHYDDLISFFSATGKGISSSSRFAYSSSLDSTEAGIYDVKVDFDGSGNITAAYMRTSGDSTWRSADFDNDAKTITGASGNDEAGLEIRVTWDGASASQTAELRFQKGLGVQLDEALEEVLDDEDGPLALRTDYYTDAMDDLDDEMDRLEDRITTKQKIYQAKFARLEATLVRMQSMQGGFQALFTQLSSMNTSDTKSS